MFLFKIYIYFNHIFVCSRSSICSFANSYIEVRVYMYTLILIFFPLPLLRNSYISTFTMSSKFNALLYLWVTTTIVCLAQR